MPTSYSSRDQLENVYTHTHMKRRRVSTRPLYEILIEIKNAGNQAHTIGQEGDTQLIRTPKNNMPMDQNSKSTNHVAVVSSDDETISVGLDIDDNLQELIKDEQQPVIPKIAPKIQKNYNLQEIENYNRNYDVNDFGFSTAYFTPESTDTGRFTNDSVNILDIPIPVLHHINQSQTVSNNADETKLLNQHTQQQKVENVHQQQNLTSSSLLQIQKNDDYDSSSKSKLQNNSKNTHLTSLTSKPCFQRIQVIFNRFLEYIKTMRWTIAFIAHEFDYSATRMGEILKLKNIKNGKRKFREWSKLSDRMVDIMNSRSLTMEYELLFQQFQQDFMKTAKKVRKRNQQQNKSPVEAKKLIVE